MSAPTTYDEIPYASYPYPQTHPDRLATVATLFGLKPAPVERCRVLGRAVRAYWEHAKALPMPDHLANLAAAADGACSTKPIRPNLTLSA